MDVRQYIQIFISLLALVNPLEGIPFLLAKTGGCDPAVREMINRRTATAVTRMAFASAAAVCAPRVFSRNRMRSAEASGMVGILR